MFETRDVAMPGGLRDSLFVWWKTEEVRGRPTKVPYKPWSHEKASVNDKKTQVSFDALEGTPPRSTKSLADRGFDGIGVVLTKDDPVVVVDLDDCIDSNGVQPWAVDIILKLNSYTEVSPSGKGIHIFLLGKKPGTKCRKDKIEIYEQWRYCTVTLKSLELPGLHWSSPEDLQERPAELAAFYAEVFDEAKEEPKREHGKILKIGRFKDIKVDHNAEIAWERLEAMCDDPKFNATWYQERKDLRSPSEYCFALVNFGLHMGWPDQDLVDLQLHWRRKHGHAQKYEAWYARNIVAAETDFQADRATQALEQMARDGVTDVAKIREGVSALFQSDIRRVIQRGMTEAFWSMHVITLEGTMTEVPIGSTDKLMDFNHMRARFLEHTGVTLPKMTKERWIQKYVSALRSMAEVVGSFFGTLEEQAAEALSTYLGSMQTGHVFDCDSGEEGVEAATKRRSPFKKDGLLHVHAHRMSQILAHEGYQVNPKQVHVYLGVLGFSRKTIHSPPTTFSYWRGEYPV